MNILDNIYEKPGNVILIQTDHISGEVIGTVIEDFYEAGAFNVQVIPTITKKNRPGYLFLIDTMQGACPQIESIIINELGATGWHQLESCHRHVGTEIWEREVVFDTPKGPYHCLVPIKVLRKKTSQMRPEHSGCLELREKLREKGVNLSLTEIRQSIIQQVKTAQLEQTKKED